MLIFLFAPGHQFDAMYMLQEICGGGLILGAFFMATDYVTSPITPNGKLVFGVCLGLLTFIFRMFGGSAEGVSYAIIFCNLLVPLIERVTVLSHLARRSRKKRQRRLHKMKNIIKDACILFAITLVAGILLGLVYNVTKDPIAQQNEKAKQKAYQEVIADADKFEAL